MTSLDEKELHRLSGMLETINRSLDSSSALREALQKAGLALILSFTRGLRPDIEEEYAQLGASLTDSQRAHLSSMGIDPASI
jgi:hypothetical protein